MVWGGEQQHRVARELDEHHRPHAVSDQVHEGLELDSESVRAAEDRDQQVEGGLEASRRPARLLAPVRVDRHRQLLGHHEVLDIRGAPAAELRAVAQVEVLGEGARAPATGVLDCEAPPHPRGAREVGEVALGRTHGLFDEEVEVNGQRLQPREPRVALVEVTPARLCETDARVVENAERAPEEIARWDEVGVEDGDEGGRGQAQPVRERARLETLTRATPHVGQADAFAPPVRRAPAHDGEGLVVRIVEQLDLQPLARPLDRAHGIDDPLSDVPLVVDRDLHTDVGLGANRDRCAAAQAEAR